MRALGLDVGRKRIGVAVSDPMGIVAQGVRSVNAEDRAAAINEICDIAKENEVASIVIGLPLNMNGTEGPMAKEVTEFSDELKKNISAPVIMWDERLTSLQIERDLVFMDVSRAKRKKINDMLSAQIILQSYLDSKAKNENEI
jgi:putative Holliday junction resolvase